MDSSMAFHRIVNFSSIKTNVQSVLFSNNHVTKALHRVVFKEQCYENQWPTRLNVIRKAKSCCLSSPKYMMFQPTSNTLSRQFSSETQPSTMSTCTFGDSKEYLLHALKEISDRNFSPENYVDIFENLSSFQTDVLRDKFSFRQEAKLFDSGRQSVEPLVHGTEFDQLLICFQPNIDDLKISSLAKSLHLLVTLGVPGDNTVVSLIIKRLMDKESVLSWRDLLKLCVFSADSSNHHLFIAKVIVPKINILINNEAYFIQDIEDRNPLIPMIIVLTKFKSIIFSCPNILRKCTYYIHKQISNDELFQNPSFIVYSLRFFESICKTARGKGWPDYHDDVFFMWCAIVEKLINSLSLCSETIPISVFSPVLKISKKICFFLPHFNASFQHHLDQFCSIFLKRCQVELQNDNIGIYTLSHMVYPLNLCRQTLRRSERQTLRRSEIDCIANRLDSLVIDQMKHADGARLGHLAGDYTIVGGPDSQRVVKELFKYFLKNYKHMTDYKVKKIFSCLRVYSPHLEVQMPYIKSDIVNKLAASFQELTYTNALTVRCIGSILPFCYDDAQVPKLMWEKILKVLPQLDSEKLQTIMYSLRKIPNPWFQHYVVFHGAITTLLKNRLQEKPSFSFAMEIIILHYHERPLQIPLDRHNITSVVQLLPELVAEMTMVEFVLYFKAFSEINFFDDQLLKTLESFAQRNCMYMKASNIIIILEYMFHVGHDIRNMEFESFCLERIEKDFNDCDQMYDQILSVYRLCQNGIFPEKLISRIFSLNFLQGIDRLMQKENAENDYMCGKLEKTLMFLNRTVVIDCPQLRVPWIMETLVHSVGSRMPTITEKVNRVLMRSRRPLPKQKFFPRVWTGNKSWAYSKMRTGIFTRETFGDQVDQIIDSILGNGFYKRGAILPYHYIADFEIYLADNNRSLLYEIGKQSKDQSFQRNVVMLLCEEDFCFNSRRLKGAMSMKTRHLQILGFKVLHIPHYDWNSMAYSTIDSKEQYLKDKIFSAP